MSVATYHKQFVCEQLPLTASPHFLSSPSLGSLPTSFSLFWGRESSRSECCLLRQLLPRIQGKGSLSVATQRMRRSYMAGTPTSPGAAAPRSGGSPGVQHMAQNVRVAAKLFHYLNIRDGTASSGKDLRALLCSPHNSEAFSCPSLTNSRCIATLATCSCLLSRNNI